MAITNNGTRNLLATAKLPTGYTVPTVTTFSDFEYRRTLTLSILKATVDEATSLATMTAIFEDATIGINKQITDILTADYLGTATVTAYTDLMDLKLNNTDVSSGEGVWLKDTPTSYVATLILYVKTA